MTIGREVRGSRSPEGYTLTFSRPFLFEGLGAPGQAQYAPPSLLAIALFGPELKSAEQDQLSFNQSVAFCRKASSSGGWPVRRISSVTNAWAFS